jgi:CBS domain-containing protein
MQTTVKEIMTTRVVCVRKDATLREMAAALRENRISAFPVLDDEGKVIGVVSEADMLAKEAVIDKEDGPPGVITDIFRHKRLRKARGITAGDLMTSTAVTVAPEDTAERAARLMCDHGVKRLPVTDASGHLVGIISRVDVLALFDRPDQDIRREIEDQEILGRGADLKAFAVTVKDGVVTLAGQPESRELGHEIVRSIRHVEGVVAVRDRLSYPPAKSPEDHFDILANLSID